MNIDDLRPRSKVFREALDKAKDAKLPRQFQEDGLNSVMWLTVAQAVKRLQLSRTTLYKLIGAGKIEAVKEGRRTFIPKEALDEYKQRTREQGGWKNARKEN